MIFFLFILVFTKEPFIYDVKNMQKISNFTPPSAALGAFSDPLKQWRIVSFAKGGAIIIQLL